MKKILSILVVLFLVLLGLLGACTRQAPIPTESELQDGVWTGTGEGRSGTILVKMTVSGHRITDVVVVSQSESSFAQDAIRVKPAIHHTMGGIRVNADMHVLRADDTPVPGLYAAGEVTGGVHGANRLGGLFVKGWFLHRHPLTVHPPLTPLRCHFPAKGWSHKNQPFACVLPTFDTAAQRL